VTFFGAGAAFYANCLKAGVDLSTCGDLSKVRALGTTGSPLSPEAQQWGTAQFAAIAATAGPAPTSGGATSRAAPISPAPSSAATASCPGSGEMQCRLLGCAVEAWNDAGVAGDRARWASWWHPADLRRCRCTSGATPTTPATAASYFEMYPPGHGRKPGGGDLDLRRRRRVAPRRLAANRRRRAALHHLRPQRRHHQPPWPAHGHQRALPRRRSTAGGGRQPGRGPGVPGPRQLHAAVRGAARRAALDEALRQRLNDADPHRAEPALRARRHLPGGRDARAPSRARSRSCRSRSCCWVSPLEKVLNREAMANPGSAWTGMWRLPGPGAFKPACSRQKTRWLDGPSRNRDTRLHLMAGSNALTA
jgi:hypothetical protein